MWSVTVSATRTGGSQGRFLHGLRHPIRCLQRREVEKTDGGGLLGTVETHRCQSGAPWCKVASVVPSIAEVGRVLERRQRPRHATVTTPRSLVLLALHFHPLHFVRILERCVEDGNVPSARLRPRAQERFG